MSQLTNAKKIINVDFEEYKTWPEVNQSYISIQKRKSPKHALIHEYKNSKAMALGTLMHASGLEQIDPKKTMVAYQGKVRRGKDWEEFKSLAEGSGVNPVSEKEYDAAISAFDLQNEQSKRLHSEVLKSILNGCEFEVSIKFNHDETGLGCKCRIDALSDGYIIDYKTTSKDLSLRSWERQIADYDLDLQAAWYSYAAKKLDGKERRFLWIIQESAPPFDVVIYGVDAFSLENGSLVMDSELQTLKTCRETGNYPGIWDGQIYDASIPEWHQYSGSIIDDDINVVSEI